MQKTHNPFDTSFIQPTAKSAEVVMDRVWKKIQSKYHDRPDLILVGWKEIVGERIAPMTEAKEFVDGILYVKVHNSSTLQNFHMTKQHLLQKIRQRFKSVKIDDIKFSMK